MAFHQSPSSHDNEKGFSSEEVPFSFSNDPFTFNREQPFPPLPEDPKGLDKDPHGPGEESETSVEEIDGFVYQNGKLLSPTDLNSGHSFKKKGKDSPTAQKKRSVAATILLFIWEGIGFVFELIFEGLSDWS